VDSSSANHAAVVFSTSSASVWSGEGEHVVDVVGAGHGVERLVVPSIPSSGPW
jgi:hypothetical protein